MTFLIILKFVYSKLVSLFLSCFVCILYKVFSSKLSGQSDGLGPFQSHGVGHKTRQSFKLTGQNNTGAQTDSKYQNFLRYPTQIC